MKKEGFLEKHLGPSWRTTLWGYVTLISGVIALNPFTVDFFPEEIAKYIKGVAGLIAIISGKLTVENMKDKSVTGGNIPSTHEAEIRVQKDEKFN